MNARAVPDAGLVVSHLSKLSGYISVVIGQAAAKAFAKEKVLDLNPGKISLFTKRDPPHFFDGPLLAVFLDKKQLENLIAKNPGADIVFVPPTSEERDFFSEKYRPVFV